MSYRIVTDSSANLTDELFAEFGLDVLSLAYYVGDKQYISYENGVSPDLKAFYKMIREGAVVTTSCVNYAACTELFEKVLSQGDDILYIGFSSGLSATYQTASAALDEISAKYPERKTFAVDSLCASLGQGLFVTYAVRMQREGKTIEEVYAWLMENRFRLCHWFTVDDLMYLKRGGRISGATALMGTMLGIKPVMHMDDEGHLIAVGKVRGRKKSLLALVDKMQELAVDPGSQTVYISHGDCIEDAEFVASKIRERFGIEDILIHYVEPVIGAHSGPGTIALFFIGQHR